MTPELTAEALPLSNVSRDTDEQLHRKIDGYLSNYEMPTNETV